MSSVKYLEDQISSIDHSSLMVDITTVAGCALLAAAFVYYFLGSIGVVFALGAGVYFWMGQNDNEEEKRRREKVVDIANAKEARRRARVAAIANLAAINATMPRHVSGRSAEALRRRQVEIQSIMEEAYELGQ